MMASEILQPGRLVLNRFRATSGWLTPYTFVFFPGFDRTAREYVTLGQADFAPDCLFGPFNADSEVITAEHVEGGWTNTDFAMLMAALKDLDSKRLVLVGASYGGQVALRYFLWQYFHTLQPFQDMAAILIATPDGIGSIRQPFRTANKFLARHPSLARRYSLQYAHHPLRFIDKAARAALAEQGQTDLIPVIAESYRRAAPLVATNLRELVAFPGFEQLLADQGQHISSSGFPGIGGRVITLNATDDRIVDTDRSVISAQRVFGPFDPVTVASGPHGWMDIHSQRYAAALVEAMVQLSQNGFGPNLGW